MMTTTCQPTSNTCFYFGGGQVIFLSKVIYCTIKPSILMHFWANLIKVGQQKGGAQEVVHKNWESVSQWSWFFFLVGMEYFGGKVLVLFVFLFLIFWVNKFCLSFCNLYPRQKWGAAKVYVPKGKRIIVIPRAGLAWLIGDRIEPWSRNEDIKEVPRWSKEVRGWFKSARVKGETGSVLKRAVLSCTWRVDVKRLGIMFG